jgi:ribosomal protein L37AE/L43A
MISLHSQTDSPLYTNLSCSIDQLEIKKQYMACPHCKKKTSEEAKGLWKCWKCLKIVDGIVTFSLNVGLADGTGKI